MDLEECIKGRRSIRLYKDKDVEWEKVVKILDAGNYAPSSGNIQNWEFILVKDSKNVEKVANSCYNQSFVIEAPLIFIICAEISKIRRLYGEKGEKVYSIQNCAMASENIMLMAYSLGLGSCFVGAFDEDTLKEDFNIPDNIQVMGIITLGYSNEGDLEVRRQDLEICTFYEKYNNTLRNIKTFPLNNMLKKRLKDIKTRKKSFT